MYVLKKIVYKPNLRPAEVRNSERIFLEKDNIFFENSAVGQNFFIARIGNVVKLKRLVLVGSFT